MKDKNRQKDRWLSSIRSPYERVFAHCNKKVRYRGLKKVQFQVGIRGLVFNLKRLMALGIEHIVCNLHRINPSSICQNRRIEGGHAVSSIICINSLQFTCAILNYSCLILY